MTVEILDYMEEALSKFSCGDYFDLRVVSEHGRSMRWENGRITVNKFYSEVGAHARVFYNGFWGSATASKIDVESLVEALKRACSIAKETARASRRNNSLADIPAINSSYEWPVKREFDDVDLSEKISDLQAVGSMVESRDYVKSVVVRLNEWMEYRYIASSEGVNIWESKPYAYFAVMATGRINGRNVTAYKNMGRIDGYTFFDEVTHEEIAGMVLDKLEKQGAAKPVKPGKYDTIVSPDLVGTLIHEAFGHLAEADFVLTGSVLAEYRGKEIAPSFITVKDVPNVDQGFGNIRFDDEGVPARDAVIVDRGVVKEFMTDRERGALLGQDPTGNARAEGYRVSPLIRMRNTVLMPGDWSLDELIEDIEYGVLLGTPLGGEANLDGTFQVGIQDAYEIVKGEVGNPIMVSSITGNSIEMLRNAVGVSKHFKIDYGFCGKMQWVPVSSGGPYLRVSKEGAPSIGAV
ncbi:MAG: TldD/PmbA family protein [Desulfurococcales archaeon]|nr:TldD/PmbA family protein [Desulfurococcales archaeon]